MLSDVELPAAVALVGRGTARAGCGAGERCGRSPGGRPRLELAHDNLVRDAVQAGGRLIVVPKNSATVAATSRLRAVVRPGGCRAMTGRRRGAGR